MSSLLSHSEGFHSNVIYLRKSSYIVTSHKSRVFFSPSKDYYLAYSHGEGPSFDSDVDDSEIRQSPPGMLLKPCKYWDVHYQPQLVNTGFLNHQHTQWSALVGVWVAAFITIKMFVEGFSWRFMVQGLFTYSF